MPIGGVSEPSVDLDRLDEGASTLQVGQGVRYQVEAGLGDFSRRSGHYLKGAFLNTIGQDPEDPYTAENPFGLDTRRSSEELNDRYAVDGYLRFNAPHTEDEAAWQASQAHERRFRDEVLSLTRPNPLLDFGAGLGGALLDPTGLAVMAATGPIGDAAFGAAGLAEGGAGALAIARMGKLANYGFKGARVLGENAIANAPYVAASGLLTSYSGDDYTLGDGLRDITAGAVLGGTVHLAGFGLRLARSRFAGATDPEDLAAAFRDTGARTPAQTPSELVPDTGIPAAVRDLPAEARTGAFVKALDDMTDDRTVDVGALVEHERAAPDPRRLDEPTAASDVASFRAGDEAVAITTRGTEVPVRYGLVELSDLVTSHTDDLEVNPAYPAQLQPRDRGRAGAQARNFQLEKELNPKLLMTSPDAAGGAPIVSPRGEVESGNGRTIALRRSAAKGGEGWARYQEELKAQGFDTSGMRQPVLVRMRTEPLTGAQRAALAREMNADVTERMSAGEQAKVDAARIPDAAFDLVGDRETPTTSRDFARAFIASAAHDQVNILTQADGSLSPEGARRIKAAVLARAYGDPLLVGQIFEGEETAARQLGEALAEAAPAWANMRALASRGEIPRELDLTAALTSAMDLVRYARREGANLAELIALRVGQTEMFGGDAISPATEAFLRLFFRDEGFTKPLPADKVAWALKEYARQASEVTPGPDLFGVTPGEDTARAILANVADRFARGDAGNLDTRPPGRSDAPQQGHPAPIIDLRRPGEDGDGGGQGLPPEGQQGAGGEAAPKKLTGDAIIAADPELKALAEDTEAMASANGIDPPAAEPKDEPNTLAEALRASAICLAEEAG